MLEKTDEQFGAILESIREVSPKVVEQAVGYYQVVDTVWIGFFGTVALLALIVGVRSYRVARRDGWRDCSSMSDHGVCVVISSLIASIASFICVCIAADLVCIYIAPDYYAAECVVELGRKAIGQ